MATELGTASEVKVYGGGVKEEKGWGWGRRCLVLLLLVIYAQL